MNTPELDDLQAHIDDLNRTIAAAPIKLTNVRARLAAGEPYQQLIRRHYPTVIKTEVDRKSPSQAINTAHAAWLRETIQLRDRLHVERLLATDLSHVITDIPAFMDYAAKASVDWTATRATIETIIASPRS